ncbi:MAG: NFACT family protein [Acutalibacteraceae bacterium]
MVQNYYEEGYPEVEIQLDPRLTPNQNVQKYYNEYRKRDTAEKKLREQIASGEAELAYIDSVSDLLARAQTDADLTAIRGSCPRRGISSTMPSRGKRRKNCRRCGLSQTTASHPGGAQQCSERPADPAGEPGQ